MLNNNRKPLFTIAAWLVLVLITIAVAAIVFTPIWLIQPFAAQSSGNIESSFILRSWSPVLTVIAALAGVGLAVFIWTNSKRWFGKAALLIPLIIIFGFTWLARQNHFEWMFNPLANANYAKVSEANFVADDDMVLAVNVGGESVAYPVRQMAYHHVVHDVVGGKPITATY
ncbi:MAG: DUF3179 domain-containing protein [Saprospiraceae bacterium]|nr:DUF3179 domain-containing protein [Pyrinomonadaceae bacterium]